MHGEALCTFYLSDVHTLHLVSFNLDATIGCTAHHRGFTSAAKLPGRERPTGHESSLQRASRPLQTVAFVPRIVCPSVSSQDIEVYDFTYITHIKQIALINAAL